MVFVDSSYLLALEMSKDDNHAPALAHWQAFQRDPSRLFTTSLVFVEVVTFLNRKASHTLAMEAGHRLLSSAAIEMIHLDLTLFQESWDFFRQHQDKRFSFADCCSFVLMRKKGVDTALSFDRHFEQAGFIRKP